jgi:lipoprotein-anchoring transpeptidase ErfK/SrfK
LFGKTVFTLLIEIRPVGRRCTLLDNPSLLFSRRAKRRAQGCAGIALSSSQVSIRRGSMRNRIQRMASSGALLAAALISTTVQAHDVVGFTGFSAGTIVVKTGERRLYFVLGEGRAVRYPVGVGRTGRQWAGSSFIDGKYVKPAWAPPAAVRHDKPWLPSVIPGDSSRNPMGAAAMTLHGGDYAIHGTNQPSSIGGFVSYGCIRMYNQDIIDLYDRVGVGTPVVVQH